MLSFLPLVRLSIIFQVLRPFICCWFVCSYQFLLCDGLVWPDSTKPEVVALLLKHGAEVNAYEEQMGTPLDQAIESKVPEVIKVLREAGGKVWKLFPSLVPFLDVIWTLTCFFELGN